MAGDDDFFEPEMMGLPEDPTVAFVIYEKRLRARTRDVTDQYDERGDLSGTSLARQYTNRLIAFIKVWSLPVSLHMDVPYDDKDFWGWYYRFIKDVDYYVVEFQHEHLRGRRGNIVAAISFSPDHKEEIGRLLERVRKVVNQAELADDKKNAIYAKIAALQSEIDRSTTRFDALLSRWLDLTNAIGEGASNLDPAVKTLERIMRIFGRAKADHDQGQLSPPEEKKQLPPPKSGYDDLDDEIPF
jgi:hypothetical protein